MKEYRCKAGHTTTNPGVHLDIHGNVVAHLCAEIVEHVARMQYVIYRDDRPLVLHRGAEVAVPKKTVETAEPEVVEIPWAGFCFEPCIETESHPL